MVDRRYQPGDLWEHPPTGAEFVAMPEPDGDNPCQGCVADQRYGNLCTTLPCTSGVTWKATNHQAEALASILRMQHDDL